MNILEGVTYRRLLPMVEPRLPENQYVYRRGRGTKRHLATLQDRTHRVLLRGRFVYVISFDVAGASDGMVPHQLISVLSEFRVDAQTRRLIHNSKGGRTFVVKYNTPQGVYFRAKKPIYSRLPQGGDLSPLLWIVVFTTLPTDLQKARRVRGDDGAASTDPISSPPLRRWQPCSRRPGTLRPMRAAE